MSIIYALISKEHEKVLCEFTEYHGNFQVITRNVIKKLKSPSLTHNKAVIIYDDMYLFYYINSSTTMNLTYLCMCENTFPYQTAFEYLEVIRDNFERTYTQDAITSAYAYTFNKDFGNILETKINFYNNRINLPLINQTSLLQKSNEHIYHIDDLSKPSSSSTTSHDDKTALIVKRFNISDEDGQSFLEGALNVQKRLTRKKNQRYLMILLILIIIAYLISAAGCGGMALPLCLDY